MSPKLRWFALGLAVSVSGSAFGQPLSQRPPSNPPALTPQTAPAAPAFKVGEVVVDRAGTRVGPIQSVAEGDAGMVVIVEIDGKLVGVPEATLHLQGARVVSAQTKAEMLAAAGAAKAS